MEGDSSLRSLRFRTWLRDIEAARPGSSVASFIDTELGSGERLLLPAEQDLPILCFRLELQGDRLVLVYTDKLGTPKASFLLTAKREYALMAEYTFNISGPLGISHSLNRLLAIPRYLERECDEKFDLYVALYKQQGDVEQSVAVTLTGGEYISVPLP